MASPTFLGVAASDELYVPYGGAGITGPLVITTTMDIPAGTYARPVQLVLLGLGAPSGFSGGADLAFSGPITDDAPVTTMPANTWELGNPDGVGGMAYDFGRPTTECFPSFDIGNAALKAGGGWGVGGLGMVGGSYCFMLSCYPKRALPAGTQITIPFTTSGTPTTLLRATLLAFQDGNQALVRCSARTMDPTDTSDGDGANVPLGDHTFADLELSPNNYVLGMVWADDSAVSAGVPVAPTISGFETVDDTSGNWTRVETGGYAASSELGGLVYSIFVADGSVVDSSLPFETFEVSGLGVDDHIGDNATFAGGTVMYRTQYAVPAGVPAASRVFPV